MAEWIIVMLGVWLILSPFILDIRGVGRISDIVVGAVVAVIIVIDMLLDGRKEAEAPEER